MALGLLHPLAGGVLRRGLKFQTCTNTLHKIFLTILGIFGSPHVYKATVVLITTLWYCRGIIEVKLSVLTSALDGHLHILTALFPVSDVH